MLRGWYNCACLLVILYNFDFIDLHTLFGYVNIFLKKKYKVFQQNLHRNNSEKATLNSLLNAV